MGEAELPPVHSWHVVNSVMISFTRSGDISSEVWDRYIDDFRDSPNLKYSISATWGSLSVDSMQRKSASEIIKAREIRAIVIANDRLTRGLVTAVSWLGVEISACSWENFSPTLDALEIEDSTRQKLTKLIVDFRDKMKH